MFLRAKLNNKAYNFSLYKQNKELASLLQQISEKSSYNHHTIKADWYFIR